MKKKKKDITDNGRLTLMIFVLPALVIVALAYLISKGFFG
jgi:hypothetical protein